ncbi:hypothetical protein RhiirA5_429683 [Rhizophagus irregularis]|uniref:Uncharacterized protein n=1 Tax=Rhizophagus irregularis TaxID=588596 RepID=A0A2N0NY11_9GLOM|nr:hypothetical protein RhiirA5_429683 [Rhizophagus irregularis]
MSQEQKNIWTSRCPGEIKIGNKCHHNWVLLAAMKILNEENIRLCNHEIKNNNDKHRIKGGRIDILDLLDKKYIKGSAVSRKVKGGMFLEDLMEADGINMLKWKHLCKEKGLNTQRKTPKWFKNIEEKILEDKDNRKVRKIKKEFIGSDVNRNIHINLFDENEKIKKNCIVTWNDNHEYLIFAEDKKRSQSKNYKRIGLHLELVGEKYDLNNSPFLKKCEGCYRNISKKKMEKKECLIYIENDSSRIIERRKEEDFIKPYETLNNIINKNGCLKKVLEQEKRNEIYNERIENIDNIIRINEDFIKLIKNSIIEEEESFMNEARKFFLIIDTTKTKSTINKKNKRIYNFNTIWKIKEYSNEKEENIVDLMFLTKQECINENEFKIILRNMIVSLMIFSNNSEIILGINEKVQNLLFEFINNFSNRRKIDSDYYLELLFLENFLENNEIKIRDIKEKEYKMMKELKKKAREMLNDKEVIKTIEYKFELIDEALITNEYNLFWNQRMITGGFRGWRKKTTLEFESNRCDFLQRQCSDKDTKERSYRIKNLLKEQPTYETLHRRNTNKIEDNKCIKCRKNEIEDWEHIWICEDNEFLIDEIIQESIYRFEERLKNDNLDEEISILRNFNVNFISILQSPSEILRGKSRIWELIRGVYNENFNNLSNKKEERSLIKKLWIFVYNEIRDRIWIQRCEEIKRLEEKNNIKKSDLRKRKPNSEGTLGEDDEEITENKNKNKKKQKTEGKLEKDKKNKLKKKISLVTLEKLTGATVDIININTMWDTTLKLV